MKLQQPIVIAGTPYSGVTLASNYIREQFGFSQVSYNSFIDGIYNDLLTIFRFESTQREITKTDLILKYCSIIERICYSPIEDNVKYVASWLKLVEDKRKELYVKREIYLNLSHLFENWRIRLVKGDIDKIPNSGVVITHPYTKSEFEFFPKTITIWIERAEYKSRYYCFKNGFYYPDEIYNTEYLDKAMELREEADFIILNDGTKEQFYSEIHKLMKEVLKFESTKQH